MNGQRLVSWRNPWFVASVGGTFAVLVFSAFVGFVWLPSAQDDELFKGLLNAICSAAGVPRSWLANASPPVPPSSPVSNVALTPTMLSKPSDASTGRGATLALRCTMCHGARGVSAANTPNLAGQYAPSVYKELRDFQNGARVSAIMAPMVVGLSDQDMRDLAAYYAFLPRLSVKTSHGNAEAPDVVATGAPMRNIAPCASCHGGLTDKVGAPWLNGQPLTYLTSQLNAFATGKRRNDISEQMRNVARQMTPNEIDEAAKYYAAQ
ncbi:c-type cytochrome [Dyella psychrodurans]|uniref:Cytochrome c4 n=1 Tax=Dyella psychrodurans TaxID=1927960 RepID=A0A370XD23_9GAMM|nr:c-type cytochrome [Dyella psychrodurans]RDS86343.1 cytochrome c4 [Dyella psychrodurans]